MRKFIKKIQDSEEQIRKRWLIGFSSATMVVVVGLWLVYMGVLINPVTQPENTAGKEELNKEPGFAEIFEAGFKVIAGKLKVSAKSALGYLKNTFGSTNEIKINREAFNRNFVLDNLKKVPRTPLP